MPVNPDDPTLIVGCNDLSAPSSHTTITQSKYSNSLTAFVKTFLEKKIAYADAKERIRILEEDLSKKSTFDSSDLPAFGLLNDAIEEMDEADKGAAKVKSDLDRATCGQIQRLLLEKPLVLEVDGYRVQLFYGTPNVYGEGGGLKIEYQKL